jgi:ferritin-like metal-binding protein YciE
MGLFSKDIQSLEDLFKHGLEDLYYAENQIVKALPDMIEKATDKKLKAGFKKHLEETEGQIHRLRQVFEELELEPKGEKCPAIEGILKEGKELMGEIGDEDTMNAGLAFAAQAVEHYEITRYGALIAYAIELGHTRCVPHLKANLNEEKAADEELSLLSELRYNPEAGKKATAKKTASPARRAKAKTTRKAARSSARSAKKRKRG